MWSRSRSLPPHSSRPGRMARGPGAGAGGAEGVHTSQSLTAPRGPRRLCLNGMVEPMKELQLIKHYF